MKVNQSAAKNRPERQNKKRKLNLIVDREKFRKAKKALYEYWKE